MNTKRVVLLLVMLYVALFLAITSDAETFNTVLMEDVLTEVSTEVAAANIPTETSTADMPTERSNLKVLRLNCDTGEFAKYNPTQLDIAVDW